jgi:hypothetical protein
MATNRNGLEIELNSKDSKVQSGKIEVVVCVSKIAHP